MQYDVSKLTKNNISLNRSPYICIGIYCFVLGTSLLGFSVYLFLESSGFVEQIFITGVDRDSFGHSLHYLFLFLFIVTC